MQLYNSKIFSNEKALVRLSLGIILLYFLPYLIYGENSRLQIMDNLDSNLIWVQLILNEGLLFPSPNTNIEQVFNGLPASAVYPYYDISLIPFHFLGIYWGYIFNKILMSLMGFWGMFFLLKKHLLKDHQVPLLYTGPALLYALLPFWSFMGSVSLLPALLYAYYNLFNGDVNWRNWVILSIYALYSSLVLTGIFVLVLLGLLFVFDAGINKKLRLTFGFGLLYLSLCYLLSHYPLLYAFFGEGGFISHRIEFYFPPHGWKFALVKSLKLFFFGKFHAYSIQPLISLPILGLFLFQKFRKQVGLKYFILLLILGLTSLLHGFKDSYTLSPFITDFTAIVPIQLHRFIFLHPVLWYVLLAMAMPFLYHNLKKGKELSLLIISLQLIILFCFHGFVRFADKPTYREFIDKACFEEIKKMIDKPLDSYRVISVGMLPSSSQFNGFYTLDGYFPNYPLSYKHEFQRIIAEELEKDTLIKNLFYGWGSTAYGFSAERRDDFLNNHPPPIQKLAFDFEAFKQMGGEYILSTAMINPDEHPDISLLGIASGIYWNIHVYQVK